MARVGIQVNANEIVKSIGNTLIQTVEQARSKSRKGKLLALARETSQYLDFASWNVVLSDRDGLTDIECTALLQAQAHGSIPQHSLPSIVAESVFDVVSHNAARKAVVNDGPLFSAFSIPTDSDGKELIAQDVTSSFTGFAQTLIDEYEEFDNEDLSGMSLSKVIEDTFLQFAVSEAVLRNWLQFRRELLEELQAEVRSLVQKEYENVKHRSMNVRYIRACTLVFSCMVLSVCMLQEISAEGEKVREVTVNQCMPWHTTRYLVAHGCSVSAESRFAELMVIFLRNIEARYLDMCYACQMYRETMKEFSKRRSDKWNRILYDLRCISIGTQSYKSSSLPSISSVQERFKYSVQGYNEIFDAVSEKTESISPLRVTAREMGCAIVEVLDFRVAILEKLLSRPFADKKSILRVINRRKNALLYHESDEILVLPAYNLLIMRLRDQSWVVDSEQQAKQPIEIVGAAGGAVRRAANILSCVDFKEDTWSVNEHRFENMLEKAKLGKLHTSHVDSAWLKTMREKSVNVCVSVLERVARKIDRDNCFTGALVRELLHDILMFGKEEDLMKDRGGKNSYIRCAYLASEKSRVFSGRVICDIGVSISGASWVEEVSREKWVFVGQFGCMAFSRGGLVPNLPTNPPWLWMNETSGYNEVYLELIPSDFSRGSIIGYAQGELYAA